MAVLRSDGSGDGAQLGRGVVGGRGGGAAGPGGVVRDADDVRVGQVGGLDQGRDAALGDEQAGALVVGGDRVGRVAAGGPAVAEDDVGRHVGGAAPGEPPREQVPQRGRDDVGAGALGGGGDDDAD